MCAVNSVRKTKEISFLSRHNKEEAHRSSLTGWVTEGERERDTPEGGKEKECLLFIFIENNEMNNKKGEDEKRGK